MNIDGVALAHQIAQDACRSPWADFIQPTEPHTPTLKITEVEPGFCLAAAAVLVELRKGHLAALTIRKVVPAWVELTAHWRRCEDGTHELTVRGDDSTIYGRAYHASLPEPDDDEQPAGGDER